MAADGVPVALRWEAVQQGSGESRDKLAHTVANDASARR